jgi:hypothetical protein
MIAILFVWYICSLRDQVVGMEVIVGPQDGPSQKLIDELEVRYICPPPPNWVYSGHVRIRGLYRP